MKKNIKFDVSLNEEQKKAKALILDNEVTVVIGKAGTGKSLVACQYALDSLFNKNCEKIIATRPAVTAGEDLGFLPGSKDEKLEEFIAPILDNMYKLYGNNQNKVDKINNLLKEKKIEILSVGHARGRSFNNTTVIVDEAQNLTMKQMFLILTRLGKNSKMIITGDLNQRDINSRSGLSRLLKLVENINGLESITLLENHRSGIVKEFINKWDGRTRK